MLHKLLSAVSVAVLAVPLFAAVGCHSDNNASADSGRSDRPYALTGDNNTESSHRQSMPDSKGHSYGSDYDQNRSQP